MPKLTKVGVSAEDIGIKVKENGNGVSARATIAAEYDELIKNLDAGSFGEVELDEGDTKVNVRNRLNAAAERRGLTLKVFKTREPVVKFKLLAKQNEPDETE